MVSIAATLSLGNDFISDITADLSWVAQAILILGGMGILIYCVPRVVSIITSGGGDNTRMVWLVVGLIFGGLAVVGGAWGLVNGMLGMFLGK